MTPRAELRLAQGVLAAVLLLPLSAAIAGVVLGPRFLGRIPVVPTDMDSHVRYLSGVLLGMLIAYASCIPALERRGDRLTMLVAITIVGGCARLASLLAVGVPSAGHLAGLGIELGVAPAMWLWQRRLAQRCASNASAVSTVGR